MINIKKLIKDYYGRGNNIIIPYSKKLTNGKEVNISKYSGLKILKILIYFSKYLLILIF